MSTNKRYSLKKKRKILFWKNLLINIIRLSISTSILYLLYFIWVNPLWNIKTIEIEGKNNNNKAFIEKLNIEKFYKNKNILLINPILLKEDILSNKRIFKQVNIERSLFPAKLKLSFLSREPYLNLKIKNKTNIFTIDKEGIILLKKYNLKTYFTINKIINYQISKEQLETIYQIYFYIENKNIDNNIGLFDISIPNDIKLYTNKNTILIGNLDDFLLKIKSIPNLEKLAEENKNKLEFIDIRIYNSPVLRIKKKEQIIKFP